MRRTALLVSLCVVLPSLVLAGLALRSAAEQGLVIERRTAALYQTYADTLAARARNLMEGREKGFRAAVVKLRGEGAPEALIPRFAERLVAVWPGRLGFVASLDRGLLSPDAKAPLPSDWIAFVHSNAAFLDRRARQPVLVAPSRYQQADGELARQVAVQRKVVPQQAQQLAVAADGAGAARSAGSAAAGDAAGLVELESDFATLVGSSPSGSLARIVGQELQVAFWMRDPERAELVYGGVLTPRVLALDLGVLLSSPAVAVPDEVCLVLLDHRTRPVLRSGASFVTDWQRPLVASPVGQLLPFWEAAVYLRNPERLAASARLQSRLLVAVSALALAAIAWGSWAVTADARRKLALARQRTDFVSAVSHELKTPLTSIRLFADLLAAGKVATAEKRDEYLRVIASEATRLSGFIDNVLDFSRLERGSTPVAPRPIDVHPVLRDAWEPLAAALAARGVAAVWEADPPPYPVSAEPEALGRVLINLVSNAEKYAVGGSGGEVTLRTRLGPDQLEVSVLDRGRGVPAGAEERIFAPFERAHEALADGVGGAGLGLAIARRLAEAMGGTLGFERRADGGSCFTLRLRRAGGGESASESEVKA